MSLTIHETNAVFVLMLEMVTVEDDDDWYIRHLFSQLFWTVTGKQVLCINHQRWHTFFQLQEIFLCVNLNLIVIDVELTEVKGALPYFETIYSAENYSSQQNLLPP